MSTLLCWMRLGENPLSNGFRLAVLNSLVAGACIAVFGGVLALVVALAETGLLLPFPFPVLVVLDAGGYILLWVAFARRLPAATRPRRLLTGLIGAAPLLLLSLLGFADVAWQWAYGDFVNNSMLDAGLAILALISTLILFGGGICAAIVTLVSRHEEVAA